ncbi:MAG: hypothetical protein MJZ96_01685 [Paludibacteraceae bacterium]|nr:hypothetical protein [Paludibacteraceae bacterium]
MKEKVLNLLKTSYAKYGFKKEELEGLAEIIGKNLADDATDEDVSNAVSGAEAWASMMQKVATRTASEVEKKYKKPVEPDPTKPEPSALEKEMAEIKTQLAAFAAERSNERLRSMLLSDERLKKIPSAFVGKYQLDKVENLDTVATQIEADFNALKAEMLKNGIVANMPNRGNDLGGDKPATMDEIKAMAAKM